MLGDSVQGKNVRRKTQRHLQLVAGGTTTTIFKIRWLAIPSLIKSPPRCRLQALPSTTIFFLRSSTCVFFFFFLLSHPIERIPISSSFLHPLPLLLDHIPSPTATTATLAAASALKEKPNGNSPSFRHIGRISRKRCRLL